MNETIHSIQNHRSIRNFTQRQVEDQTIDLIIKSAQAMPNSINGQQVSVIVIKDKEKKAKFAELTVALPALIALEDFTAIIKTLYFFLAFSHLVNEISPTTNRIIATE